MNDTNEAFARFKIDNLLKDAGWNPDDGTSVRFEEKLTDGTKADYVLCNRHGKAMAVLEAKRASVDLVAAQDQGRHYAEQLGVPFVFLSNGEEVLFLDYGTDAHARKIDGFYGQDDLERRTAVRQSRRDLSTVAIDRKIVNRDYQIACIEALSDQVSCSRRNLLVEMATGTGKTRTAAAFIKRLFQANIITRVLFLVDRIALARQAEDAFNDHLRDYPCHVLRPGRCFDRAQCITIATLQTMIAEYRKLSPGYFDLVITDECHRSIYGKWSAALRHFDSIQLGLTATPCTADTDMLPDPEDGLFVRDTLLFFQLDQPTFRYTLHEAIREKHLVPYGIYRARTVKTAAKEGFTVGRQELDWCAMDQRTRAGFEELFSCSDTITVDPQSLERKFTIPERNRALVREFREQARMHGEERGKTIVFAVNCRHAETLAGMLDEHFADLKPHAAVRYADFVVSDMGGGPAPDASAIIHRFKEEDYPKILVSVNMLDTGFDCPEVVNLVMARFTKSRILYQQMRGRGTRKAPHIGKTRFTIYDFAGVTDLHGDNEDGMDGSAITTSGHAPNIGKSDVVLTLDVDDHIDPLSRDWFTVDENGRIVHSPEDEACAAKLGIRFEGWRSEHHDAFNGEQARWLGLIGSRIRSNATGMDGLGTWIFDEHPFKTLGGYDEARRVFGGADALDQLIAGINGAVFQQREASDQDDNPGEQ